MSSDPDPKDVPWNRVYKSPGEATIYFSEGGSYISLGGLVSANQTLDDGETVIPEKKYITNEDYFDGKWSGTVDWSPSAYKNQARWTFTAVTFTPNFGYIQSGKKKIVTLKYDWEAQKEWELGKDLTYSFSKYDYQLDFNQTTSTSPPWVDPNDTTVAPVLDCNVWEYHKNSDIEGNDFESDDKYKLQYTAKKCVDICKIFKPKCKSVVWSQNDYSCELKTIGGDDDMKNKIGLGRGTHVWVLPKGCEPKTEEAAAETEDASAKIEKLEALLQQAKSTVYRPGTYIHTGY